MPFPFAQEVVVDDRKEYCFDEVIVRYTPRSVAHVGVDPTSIHYMDKIGNADMPEELLEKPAVPEADQTTEECVEQSEGNLTEGHWGNPLSGRSRIHSTLHSFHQNNVQYIGAALENDGVRKKSLSFNS